MAQKKAVIGAMAFLLTALIVFSVLALAAELGDKEDPLVGLSYLQGLEPQLKESIDRMTQEKMDEYSRQLDASVADALRRLGDALGSADGGGGGTLTLTPEQIQAIANEVARDLPTVPAASGGETPATYVRVEIPAGKTVTFGIGASFYLRTGSATVHSTSSPGLIDLTTGEVQDSGEVKFNHLYSVTFDYTKGFKTGSASIAMIMGPYRIS